MTNQSQPLKNPKLTQSWLIMVLDSSWKRNFVVVVVQGTLLYPFYVYIFCVYLHSTFQDESKPSLKLTEDATAVVLIKEDESLCVAGFRKCSGREFDLK